MAYRIIDAEVRLLPEEAAVKGYLEGDSDPIKKKIYDHENIEAGFPNWGADRLISSMSKNFIDKAVISGLPFRNKYKARVSTEYLLSACLSYPERFRALYSPRFEDVDKELETLRDLIPYGFVGVEVIPDWQGLGFIDPSFDIFFQFISEQGLLVKIFVPHVYSVDTNSVGKRLVDFCIKYPDIRVVTPHLGGMLFWYQEHPELRSVLSQIGYISSLPTSPHVIECALSINDSGLMFGTDFPFNWNFEQRGSLEALSKVGITPGTNEKFFYENARAFFKF